MTTSTNLANYYIFQERNQFIIKLFIKRIKLINKSFQRRLRDS